VIKYANVTQNMIEWAIPDDPCHCAIHYALEPIFGIRVQVHGTHVDTDGSGTTRAKFNTCDTLRQWIGFFDAGLQVHPILLSVDFDNKFISVVPGGIADVTG
jgi:hypothetical protein